MHADHLNTPRLIADTTGTPVWKWDQVEPFGVNTPDENPSGLGAFDLPLRLPGQYYDKETNLHYNMGRDYDPGGGRYAQGDPIGLRGGWNIYAYALSNPLTFIDKSGNLPVPQILAITAAVGTALVAHKAYKQHQECRKKADKLIECQERKQQALRDVLKGVPNAHDLYNQRVIEEKRANDEVLACSIDLGKALTELYTDLFTHAGGRGP